MGAFVYFTPQLCLLVEDETRVVGFAAAALDAQQLHARLEVEGSWVSQMKNKYPVSLFKQPSETKAQVKLINHQHHKISVLRFDASTRLHLTLFHSKSFTKPVLSSELFSSSDSSTKF